MSATLEHQHYQPRRGIDWDIFEARTSSGVRIEIEKCDDSSYFASDDGAASWVLQSACDRAIDALIRSECQHAIRQLAESWDEEAPNCRLR